MDVSKTPFEVRESIRRGRPPLAMTPRRCQMIDELNRLIDDGERVTMAELAKRCGLYDYRDARRIIRDLRKIGSVV